MRTNMFNGISHPARRKALAVLLAFLMTFSTAAPAFADLFAFVEIEDAAPVYKDGEVEAGSAGYGVKVSYGADAEIPDGTELIVTEIPEGTLQFDEYSNAAEKTVGEDEQLLLIRFFDITLQNEAGEKIEPAAPVAVEIRGNEIVNAEKVTVVHFPKTSDPVENPLKKGSVADRNALKAEAPAEGVGRITAEIEDVYDESAVSDLPEMEIVKEGEGPAVSFMTDGFSVYGIVVTKLVTEVTLPGRDEIYEVAVTYGPEAQIPENVHLEVTAFAEGSEEYYEAKDIIFPESENDDFGFAALDISIVDKDGNKIEPAEGAEVNVSLKLLELPGDLTEEEFLDTFEVNHISDYNGNIEVESVEFTRDVQIIDGVLETEFAVNGFSTFTIVWGTATNTTTSLRLRAQGTTGNQYNNTVGAVVFNYVNSDGYPITRPGNVGGNVDINVSYRTNNFSNHEIIISSDNVARTINNRTYQRAYIIVNGIQQEVTRILFSRTGNNSWSTAYYNGDTLVTTASGTNVTGDWRIPVYLEYTGDAATSEVTLHFVDRDGNPLSGFKYGDTTLSDTASYSIAELFPANGDTLDLTTAFTKEG